MVLKDSILKTPFTEILSSNNPCTIDQEDSILSEADFISDIPNAETAPNVNNVMRGFQANDLCVPYSTFYHHKKLTKNLKLNSSITRLDILGHILEI